MFFLLKFLSLLLDGGNAAVQKTIYDFFISSPSSERLFEKLDSILAAQIRELTTGSKVFIGPKSNKITVKLLRLLQLFCEGHNIDLQNYLRNQSNSKKSYDLVTTVVRLLSAYKINDHNYDAVL